MIGKIENQINPRDKYIDESKITNKNIYSKIAPPNTFKRRNTNQNTKKTKLFQRFEKTPQSNQIDTNPYISYKSNNSNFSKRTSFISNNKTFISNADSNIKLYQNVNSSFREKIKIIKGNLFNNQNNIISPKKLVTGKMKVNINYKIDNHKLKLPGQYITKNKSVYVKKEKNNILKNFDESLKLKDNKKIEINNNIKNETNFNNDNDNIKEKYDFLLEKTRNLLNNYQKIVDYYQEKEKNNKNKMENKE